MEININLMEDCSKEYDKVFFISEKTIHEIEIKEDMRKKLLIIDKYIEYSKNTYDNEFKAYTVYKIKDRAIDEHNNLLLFGEDEYINK